MGKDLRILVVTREYGRFIVGGIGVVATKLAEYLRREGVEVHVLSFGDPAYSNDLDHYIEPKSSVIAGSKQVTKVSHDIMLIHDIQRITREAKSLSRRLNVDVLHVQEPYIGGLITHEAKITTIHTTGRGEIQTLKNVGFYNMQDKKKLVFYSTLGLAMEYSSIVTSHVIIAPSNTVKNELLKFYKVLPEKVIIIHNGVDVPDESEISYKKKLEAKVRLGLPPEKLIVFTTMRHIPRKRVDLLIEAVYKLLRRNASLRKNLLVVIGGTGPITPQLKKMASSLGLNDLVVFTGWIPGDVIHLYYLASDIYVLPSSSESAPLSLLEACAYGLPVITTRVGDYAVMMKNLHHAIVIPPDNVDELAEALLMLVQDEQLRRKLSRNAREFAKGFSWEKIARKHLGVYEVLISGKSRKV